VHDFASMVQLSIFRTLHGVRAFVSVMLPPRRTVPEMLAAVAKAPCIQQLYTAPYKSILDTTVSTSTASIFRVGSTVFHSLQSAGPSSRYLDNYSETTTSSTTTAQRTILS
jgi:hypothetical protein